MGGQGLRAPQPHRRARAETPPHGGKPSPRPLRQAGAPARGLRLAPRAALRRGAALPWLRDAAAAARAQRPALPGVPPARGPQARPDLEVPPGRGAQPGGGAGRVARQGLRGGRPQREQLPGAARRAGHPRRLRLHPGAGRAAGVPLPGAKARVHPARAPGQELQQRDPAPRARRLRPGGVGLPAFDAGPPPLRRQGRADPRGGHPRGPLPARGPRARRGHPQRRHPPRPLAAAVPAGLPPRRPRPPHGRAVEAGAGGRVRAPAAVPQGQGALVRRAPGRLPLVRPGLGPGAPPRSASRCAKGSPGSTGPGSARA